MSRGGSGGPGRADGPFRRHLSPFKTGPGDIWFRSYVMRLGIKLVDLPSFSPRASKSLVTLVTRNLCTSFKHTQVHLLNNGVNGDCLSDAGRLPPSLPSRNVLAGVGSR